MNFRLKSEGEPPSLRYVVYSLIGIAPSAAGGARGDADEQGKRPPPVELQPRCPRPPGAVKRP